MSKTLLYEWVVETVTTDEYEDIEDCDFWDTAADALRVMQSPPDEGYHYAFALVRSRYDSDEGMLDRQYAYVEKGELPSAFEEGALIPKAYREELRKALS